MTNIVLLIFHGLCAVLLIGALTHQAISLFWGHKGARDGFFRSARGVRAVAYTNAVVVLFIIVFAIGSVLYPEFRVNVRMLWDVVLPAATGSFEIKEHMAAVGLGILPAYWLAWQRSAAVPEKSVTIARAVLTGLLTYIVWADFLLGHILNNLHGL
jgi:hypothetical protein